MFFMFDNEPPAATPIDFLALPGFAEAKRHLEDVGATFLKDGRPWYKSRCPNYEGYWLEGGTGSVQCGSYGGLLPGLMWDTTCKGGFEKCPFCTKGEQHE